MEERRPFSLLLLVDISCVPSTVVYLTVRGRCVTAKRKKVSILPLTQMKKSGYVAREEVGLGLGAVLGLGMGWAGPEGVAVWRGRADDDDAGSFHLVSSSCSSDAKKR